MRRTVVLLALQVAAGAAACDSCSAAVRRQVREGIWNGRFAGTAAAVLAPLAAMALIIAAVHVWPRRG